MSRTLLSYVQSSCFSMTDVRNRCSSKSAQKRCCSSLAARVDTSGMPPPPWSMRRMSVAVASMCSRSHCGNSKPRNPSSRSTVSAGRRTKSPTRTALALTTLCLALARAKSASFQHRSTVSGPHVSLVTSLSMGYCSRKSSNVMLRSPSCICTTCLYNLDSRSVGSTVCSMYSASWSATPRASWAPHAWGPCSAPMRRLSSWVSWAFMLSHCVGSSTAWQCFHLSMLGKGAPSRGLHRSLGHEQSHSTRPPSLVPIISCLKMLSKCTEAELMYWSQMRGEVELLTGPMLGLRHHSFSAARRARLESSSRILFTRVVDCTSLGTIGWLIRTYLAHAG
mmetsp:Transcript_16988/g.47847  ORF Transcript_16988/g.47847 Transcript_16988/m.47847 type:complete len:336 (-) Transcript_16988:1219-2226(-)